MIIGVMRLRLHLPEARSLKDKRGTILSLMSRLRNRYGVSVAEVADQDSWQTATIGVACVSASEAVCRRLLDDLGRWVEGAGPFVVCEKTTEMR